MQVSLSAANVTKRYGGVVALADGNLDVRSGEVVALVGANGSGKSTLSKIITGVVSADDGQILLDDEVTSFVTPHAARARGVTAVYQELSLIPDMTVQENIWLTHEPMRLGTVVNRREERARTQSLIDLFEGAVSDTLNPDATIRDLSPDEKQIVEILKAWSIKPRLLILDEATASLDVVQVSRLFDLVREWKQQGAGIIFVSHRMEEVFAIADRAVVLRNGYTVGDLDLNVASERDLVQLMIGDAATAVAPAVLDAQQEVAEARVFGDVRLSVSNLATETLRGIGLELRDGELLGLGGLRGQGQEDVLMSVFGATPYAGEVIVSGNLVHFRHPKDAMAQGVAYVPGERNAQGLLSIRSILENLQLPSWAKYGFPLRMGPATADAQRVTDELRIVMSGLDAPVSSLSGGNAQKVVIGKWLMREPRLLLLNDPTKGVDVGAKGEIYRLLSDLRRAGAAILFYSSDDEELLVLCDRVLVLHDGKVRAELAGDTLTRDNLIAASVGASHHDSVGQGI
jgi:ribose transport system ATP-binding protein